MGTATGVYLSDKELKPYLIQIPKKNYLKNILELLRARIYTCVFTEDYGDDSVLRRYAVYANDEGLIQDDCQFNIAINPDLVEEDPDMAGIISGPVVVLAEGEKGLSDIDDVLNVVIALKNKLLMNEYRRMMTI